MDRYYRLAESVSPPLYEITYPLSREEFLVFASIFELSGDNPEDDDRRLRHLSKLILKINSEYSVASSITNGRFRFEMYINSAVLDNDQSCFLVQMFLNDCDFLISENRELPQNSGNLFNNIPVAFRRYCLNGRELGRGCRYFRQGFIKSL